MNSVGTIFAIDHFQVLAMRDTSISIVMDPGRLDHSTLHTRDRATWQLGDPNNQT
jgi:hypothetical protein